MSKIEAKLEAMGLTLPEPPAKGGLYSPAKTFSGNLVYISGCGHTIDGSEKFGKLGKEITLEEGQLYAQKSMLNVLAVLKREIGDLDRVKSAVKVTCFVASEPDFYSQPQVANGGTKLLIELFGENIGAPTRSAVGMAVLPNNLPVETEAIFEITD